jgi:glycosyltransferase involved in cell wall biosynthesis
MSPLVSVAIPVKNGFLNKSNDDITLDKVLNSILKQNYYNLEIIISNNNSIDKTKNYLEEISQTDRRIKYFNIEKDISWAENFDFLLKKCTGKYFKWNAADDLISQDYIEKNVEFLERNQEYVSSSSKFYYENDMNKFYSFDLDENLYTRIKDFFHIRHISHNIFFSLMRRNVTNKIICVSKDYWAIDWIFNLELLLNGKFKTLENGYIIFGTKGISREESYVKKYLDNKKKIYKYLPFYELMKDLFKKTITSKELSFFEKISIYFSLFKLNIYFIKKHRL